MVFETFCRYYEIAQCLYAQFYLIRPNHIGVSYRYWN
jgi:hypothetical protein